MLSDCQDELQLMANVIKRRARKDRVTIHPVKSKAILLQNHVSKKGLFQTGNGQ